MGFKFIIFLHGFEINIWWLLRIGFRFI